jgi:G patch domain-containing protein 1
MHAHTCTCAQDEYDTFGASAADAAVRAAQEDARSRPSLIPGPIIDDIVVPVANSIGMRLLQRMGWRPGRGIGSKATLAAAAGGGGGGGGGGVASGGKGRSAGSKWGTVSGVSLDNTPLYVLEPKVRGSIVDG